MHVYEECHPGEMSGAGADVEIRPIGVRQGENAEDRLWFIPTRKAPGYAFQV